MDNIILKIDSYLKYYNDVFDENIYFDEKIEFSDEKIEKYEEKKQHTIKENNILTEGKIIENNSTNIHTTVPNPQIQANSVDGSWAKSESLEELHKKIKNCNECPLGKTRSKLVFGSGNENADILIIGEGPGADEDLTGLPFVGRAGQLLTKILEAIELSRDEVYIANIVKCRPPGNRRPETIEVDQCEPYLLKQIELIKPKFILALGLTAIETLFKTKYKMADIRGKILEYHQIKTLATYHPAALLRNPNYKKGTWEDVKLLKKLYLESKEKKL